jgi:hypothetical protein
MQVKNAHAMSQLLFICCSMLDVPSELFPSLLHVALSDLLLKLLTHSLAETNS